MKSLKSILLSLLFACLIVIPQLSFAEDDTCDPEPTDMTLDYGSYYICSISPAGDSDTYRIWGNEGDRMHVVLASLTKDRYPYLIIIDPDGENIFNTWAEDGVSFDSILTKTGRYTINITFVKPHNYENRTGQYSLHFTCNGGSCLPESGEESYQAGYDKGYFDGQETCDNNVVCTQVITYGKVPDTGCWVEFPTPCDVPDGWESTSEQPENMCGVVVTSDDDRYDEGYQDGIATCVSEDTGITLSPELNMHVPMMQYSTLLGNLKLWGDFEFTPGENGELLWRLVDFGEVE